MIVIALTVVHVILCFFLVIVILLQSGKAADLAGAFGGMGSQTAFGPRGSATLLSKATTFAAAAFMATSLTLAIFATRAEPSLGKTVFDSQKPVQTQQGPTTPLPAAPAGQSGNTMSLPIPPPQGQQQQQQKPAAQQPPAAPAKK
jgi:preprotein translocase subunit SecG